MLYEDLIKVSFERSEKGYRLSPIKIQESESKMEIWNTYSRDKIPGYFGLEFSTGSWNQGFVHKGENIFLLVTLEKADLATEFGYKDHFLSKDLFQWQSQNRTTQKSSYGQKICQHAKNKINVQLYIRVNNKINGRAAPFYYCGKVDFVSWEGEQPITVKWRLQNEVPGHLRLTFKIPDLEK